jgi:hypothetical protein
MADDTDTGWLVCVDRIGPGTGSWIEFGHETCGHAQTTELECWMGEVKLHMYSSSKRIRPSAIIRLSLARLVERASCRADSTLFVWPAASASTHPFRYLVVPGSSIIQTSGTPCPMISLYVSPTVISVKEIAGNETVHFFNLPCCPSSIMKAAVCYPDRRWIGAVNQSGPFELGKAGPGHSKSAGASRRVAHQLERDPATPPPLVSPTPGMHGHRQRSTSTVPRSTFREHSSRTENAGIFLLVLKSFFS